jgi:hypothetical protein
VRRRRQKVHRQKGCEKGREKSGQEDPQGRQGHEEEAQPPDDAPQHRRQQALRHARRWGQFKDIQTYKRAHGSDVQRDAKDED